MANILIVEDDNAIAQAYMIELVKQHQVQIAPDAATGLQLANTTHPDIILLDMLMPGFSGLDFLRNLDPKKNLPKTKVIAISNAESAKIIAQAKELGADDYLLKVDYTPQQVEALISQIIDHPSS